MKRSNRLVLLIGIFLAIVAFVLIIVAARRRRPATPDRPIRRAHDRPRSSSRPRTSPSATRSPGDQVGPQGRSPSRSARPRRFGDTSLVIGQIARTSVLKRPAHHHASSSTAPAPSRTSRSPPASSPWRPGRPGHGRRHDHQDRRLRGRHQRLHAATRSRSSVPGVADDTPRLRDGRSRRCTTRTTVKVLSQGLQVLGTLLPPPPRHANANPQAQPRPGAAATTVAQRPAADRDPRGPAAAGRGHQVRPDRRQHHARAPVAPRTSRRSPPTASRTARSSRPPASPSRRLVDDRGVLPPQVVQVHPARAYSRARSRPPTPKP